MGLYLIFKRGVGSNIYFFDHRLLEFNNDYLQSKMDPKEAELIVHFVSYLVANHYSPNNITVLTLYSGQLFQIKQEMKKKRNLKGLIISTVDNYQGDENDIVILSLVRSNKQNNLGFLKASNRICVALSRAKKGILLFGIISKIFVG